MSIRERWGKHGGSTESSGPDRGSAAGATRGSAMNVSRKYAVRLRVERATCPFLWATSPQALLPRISLIGESNCRAKLGGKLPPRTGW